MENVIELGASQSEDCEKQKISVKKQNVTMVILKN